jgi:hypothetical protein
MAMGAGPEDLVLDLSRHGECAYDFESPLKGLGSAMTGETTSRRLVLQITGFIERVDLDSFDRRRGRLLC